MLKILNFHYPVILAYLLGTAVSLCVYFYARQAENLEVNRSLVEKTTIFDREFNEHLQQYATLVDATSAFFSSSEDITPEEFEIFSSRLLKASPEAISMQFVMKVPADNLQAYIDQTKAARPGFRVWESKAGEQAPYSPGKKYYYPLHYIADKRGAEIPTGLELSSIPNLQDAFNSAERVGSPILSPPFKAFEEDNQDIDKDDFYVILPLDPENLPRLDHIADAFIVIGVDLRQAVSKIFGSGGAQGIHTRVSVFDQGTFVPLYETFSGEENFDPQQIRYFIIMGQTFRMEYAYGNEFFPLSRWHSYSLLLGGMLLTILLTAYVYLWRQKQRKDEQAREKLNREILEREALYSQMKSTQEEATRQKILLETILDNMPLAIFVKNVRDQYRYILFNRAAEEIFQIKESEALGKGDYDYFLKEEADFFRSTDIRVMAEGKVVDISAEPVTTVRGSFTAHTIKVPIYDEHGVPELLVGILEDVTEKIKFLEELRITKEQAEAANIAKTDFLTNMSHELRTPLNSILGMNRLLLESNLAEEQRALAETVLHSSVNLLEIVNDILDLSKIEAGEMVLESIGFDINYVFSSVFHTLEPLAREKNVDLKRNHEAHFPYVVGDPLRVTRIMINVISNAIKYTDQGYVEFSAHQRTLDDGRIEVCCEIKDTGIGIPKDKLERIFEKFGQADTSTTRKYGGTGLGLAITRELVDMMGGRIDVESEVGTGSIFKITIPFETTAELSPQSRSRQKRDATGTRPIASARILIAEDHPANQILIRKLMDKFKVGNFAITNNGLEALQQWNAASWDILLMDCHMPELNGYDTTTEIRAQEKGTDKHIPIVAMTANAMVGEREKCLRYGMDDYISKPIDMDELKEILSQWFIFDADVATVAVTADVNAPVDFTQMRTFTDGDVETEKELVSAFIQQSDINMKTLKDTSSGDDHKAWTEAAHMLKGGAGGIGAYALQKLCNDAQHFSGTDSERSALYEQIFEEYGRVKEYLKSLGLVD